MIALSFLIQNGYQIIETNWRFGKIEIDIIAAINDLLVFIEVKTLDNDFLRKPYEAVTSSKQQKIIKAAEAYLDQSDTPKECRFDVISIVHNKERSEIQHIEEAFFPLA